jgi:hypothetical protein
MTVHYTTDDGATWLPLTSAIRVCYIEAYKDADGPLDLLVQLTPTEVKAALINDPGLVVGYRDEAISYLVWSLK